MGPTAQMAVRLVLCVPREATCSSPGHDWQVHEDVGGGDTRRRLPEEDRATVFY